MVSVEDVRGAAERIRPYVVRTPIERSAALSELAGVDVWLKLECFQSTGSFKLRGALNALTLRRAPEVLTASAGNHGLGVARAASMLGVKATVVVPKTASPTKVQALRRSGAELLQIGETYDDAEAAGLGLAQQRGLPFISPYNDPDVIAGGGTVALEILEDVPSVRSFIVPAGGGGLIGGVGVAASGLSVYGVQSEASPALHAALAAGRLVRVDVLPSLADGLAGNVESGSITFDLLRSYVKEVGLVSEEAIARALVWLALHEHVIVEGSAATGVAAVLGSIIAPAGPIAILLTGRNVASSTFQALVSKHLTSSVASLNDSVARL